MAQHEPEPSIDGPLRPPALTEIPEVGSLTDLPISERPLSHTMTEWCRNQVTGVSWKNWRRQRGISTLQRIETMAASYIEKVKAKTDRWSPAQTYTPIDASWIQHFYDQPNMSPLRDYRAELINSHVPERAMLLLIDLQSVFGMEPVSQPARKQLTQRSFGEDNLRQMADFIKQGIRYGLYVGLTTMVHSGQTTMERWRQQQAHGLASPTGDFYLCPVGSIDTMIHPLLLHHLGFSEAEIIESEMKILLHTLSADLGRAYSLPFIGPTVLSASGDYQRRSIRVGDALAILEKPERVLSRDNFEQLVSVDSTDIFVGGADIHVCVAEVVNNLRFSAGHQPNIWIVADLSVTRPQDFKTAREVLGALLESPSKVFLITQEEADQLIQRNINRGYLTLEQALVHNSWFGVPPGVHFELYGNT